MIFKTFFNNILVISVVFRSISSKDIYQHVDIRVPIDKIKIGDGVLYDWTILPQQVILTAYQAKAHKLW